jgi:hypothetical protein
LAYSYYKISYLHKYYTTYTITNVNLIYEVNNDIQNKHRRTLVKYVSNCSGISDMVLVCGIIHQRLQLCVDNFWTGDTNIGCCFNSSHTILKYKLWKVENFLY